jgi:hypothetical protein
VQSSFDPLLASTLNNEVDGLSIRRLYAAEMIVNNEIKTFGDSELNEGLGTVSNVNHETIPALRGSQIFAQSSLAIGERNMAMDSVVETVPGDKLETDQSRVKIVRKKSSEGNATTKESIVIASTTNDNNNLSNAKPLAVNKKALKSAEAGHKKKKSGDKRRSPDGGLKAVKVVSDLK